MKAVIVDSLLDGPAGAIKFLEREGGPGGIMFNCPCGCGNRSFLAFDNGENPHPCWVWNGNKAAPTLRPSVFNSGLPCLWHGFLTNGQWVTV